MSDSDTKEKGKEEGRPEGTRGFRDMCREMMSGGMPDCRGPEMRKMMSACCARAGKTEGAVKSGGSDDAAAV